MNFLKNNSNSFPSFYFFIISFIVGIIFVRFFFLRDYNQILNQVKGSLINFSQQKENSVSQFLSNYSDPLQFKENPGLINTISITNNGQEIPLDDLRKSLSVEQQQALRLNAYLVNDKGDLLTAQKEFDTSSTRSNAKVVRTELLDQCLNGNNSNQENFYTGVDEGNRSVFGIYQKVSSSLPLCLFSETEKVTNIDIPAQQILEQYIFLGLFFVLIVTFLGKYFSSFYSPFTMEEIILFVLCGATVFSYSFLVSLFTRGINYFSPYSHLLELAMATFSFSLLVMLYPSARSRHFRTGALLLIVYFLLTIFFEEYRQAYALSSTWRNFILVLMRFFSIGGFLSLFFSFKKNAKL
jgi:hypothetical protein